MFALGIRYLNGFAAAGEPHNRERAEWPPHPGRVFMALAAAHFQTGADPAEREALRWIESLPTPPVVRVPEASQRLAVQHFVPVNDDAIWKKKKKDESPPPPLQAVPSLIRRKQERRFARAWLEDDVAYFAWPDADAHDPIRRTLATLCGRVTRIGHSTSLVHMWLAEADEVPEPNWVPTDEGATIHLRVAGPGTLAELERRYNYPSIERFTTLQVAAADNWDNETRKAARQRLKEEFDDEPPPRLRPEISSWQGYARPLSSDEVPATPGTLFNPSILVCTLEGKSGPYRQLDLACTLIVTQRWREALVSQSNELPDRVRHIVSGHNADREPLSEPHLAFFPLGFVGHSHADGHLVGMALALPKGLGAEERRGVLRAVGRVRELKLGRLGVWAIQHDTSAQASWNLQPEIWTAHSEGATHWSTVTPIVFDRHPKSKTQAECLGEVAGMIEGACGSIGLPNPREVIVTPVSAHLGVPPAHAFPRLQRKDGSERRHTHAILVFDCPVRGPVLLGAGRYRGYGLCRPMGDTAKPGR